MRPFLPLSVLVLLPVLVVACGGDDAAPATATTDGTFPYEKDRTVVIGPDGKAAAVPTPDGKDCLELANNPDDCTRPQETCGEGGRADVVVDAKGKVVAVICYPVDGTPVSTVPEGGTDSVGAENKEVVVIDGKDDGVDVTGDVSITGNNVVVYGAGPETSIIGGNVDVEKNNGTVHGVRVKGDVRIDGNNTALVDCVIDGNLTITSNNNVVASCTVFGKITVSGNNNTLFYDRVCKGIEGDNKNLACEGNVLCNDANADGLLTGDELGAAIACGGGK